MDVGYNVEKVEKLIHDLLKNTLKNKGVKKTQKLIDDIMNERQLDVDHEILEELRGYSTDTLRLVVEKQILLSLENSSLANRKSYWDVLKTRAPRIKVGIMSHYYDSYINFLKQDNPATYQARTIRELKEAYNKVIGENISVINDMGNAVIGNISGLEIEDEEINKVIKINGLKRGSLVFNRESKINNGKFVNKEEFVHLLGVLDGIPNSKQLITDNPNISLNDLKIVANDLSHCLNVETKDDIREVTYGQAGVLYAGDIDKEPTLPDGTYISLEELSLAVNKYLNRPKEEEKPKKVVSIKQKIKRKVAVLTMSITVLTAALPVLKKNIDVGRQNVVTQVNDTMEETNVAMSNEQLNNSITGVADAIEKVSGQVIDVGNTIVETVTNLPNPSEVINNLNLEVAQVEEPINDTAVEEIPTLDPVQEVSTASDNNLEETVTEPIIESNDENTVQEVSNLENNDEVTSDSENNIEDISEPVEEKNDTVIQEIDNSEKETVSEPVEENNNEEVETPTSQPQEVDEVINNAPEEKIATSSDFSFKFDESNEIAAAARNRGFTDEQIKITIAISRQETGNYTSPAFLNKHNYGGMMNKNYEPMTFATKEEGLDKFLTMLQDKYFGQGLNTLEQIGHKYDKNNPAWPGKVQATIERNGLEPREEEPEIIDSAVEENNSIEEVAVETEEQDVESEKKDSEIVTEKKDNEIESEKEDSDIEKVVEPINSGVEIETTKVELPKKETQQESQTKSESKKDVQVEQPVVSEPVVQPIVPEPVVVEQPVIVPDIQPQVAPTGDAASMLGLTPAQLDVVKATIRHEAGNNPAEIANVASVVKNRMNKSGTNAYAVITSPNQFQSYGDGYYKQFTGGNYYQGDPATLAQVNAVMDAILTGQMAPTHGYSNFRDKRSEYGTQLVDGGNKYR